jgi:hypothetical protein
MSNTRTPRRLLRRAAVAAVSVTALGLPVFAAIASADPSPSITVSPSTGLVDGQSVTVTGTGYTDPGDPVWVGQCSNASDPAVCDHELAHQVFVQVDGNGGFTTTITVHETFQGATDANPGDPIPVDCRVAPGCFVSGGQANPNISALQFISFDS